MPLIYEDDLVPVELRDGETAFINRELTGNDIDNLTAEEAKELQSGANNFKLLELCVKKWDVKDKEGNVAEITLENLKRLSLLNVATLVEAIGNQNPFVMKLSIKLSGQRSKRATGEKK